MLAKMWEIPLLWRSSRDNTFWVLFRRKNEEWKNPWLQQLQQKHFIVGTFYIFKSKGEWGHVLSVVMFWVWSCSVYHFAPCICIAVHEQKFHPLIMVVWGDSRPRRQWSVVTDWIPNYAMIGWGGGLCFSMTFSMPEPEYISLVCRDGNIASKIKSEPVKLPYDCHYQVGLDFSAWILQAYWLGFDFRNFRLSVSDCSVHEMTLIVFRG